MDDLFVIDTQGSASTNVGIANSSREFRAVSMDIEPRRQIRVIEDEFIPSSSSSNSSAQSTCASTPRSNGSGTRTSQPRNVDGQVAGSRVQSMAGSRGTAAIKRLNSQFLELDVGQAAPGGNGRRERRSRRRDRARAAAKDGRVDRSKPPPVERDPDFDEVAEDYMANVSDGDFLDGRVFSRRELGDGPGHHFSTASATLGEADTSSDDGLAVEDPFEIEDRVVASILDGSGDEALDDDGFPYDMDMEAIPGPDKDLPVYRPKHKGAMGWGAPVVSVKDRGKGKRGHQQQQRQRPKKDGHEGVASWFDPRTVVRRMDMLLQSDDLGSMWLQPMGKRERQIVHVLAREYKIKSKSHGSGVRRTPVLTTTPDSFRPTNRRRIEKILLLHEEGGLLPEEWLGGPSDRFSQGNKKGKGRNKNKGGGSAAAAAAASGKLVGENAPEVGASNIGHKMLQQMGWTPGQGLGTNEKGRATPVDVMIRNGRQGLGS
ncbi:squalene synthetase-like protein [Coemansia sp. RSA 552]|nr:squalene synthetase-like protein [Coemansia sp. RSA 552]